MWADLGFFLLLLSCVLSIYGFCASLFSARLRHRRLFRSAKMAATVVMALSLGAALLLWLMLYFRDYSVGYVYRNSSSDLPLRYTLSAFWSALEGSHFLWALLLAIYSGIAHWTYARDNEHIMPYVSASLQAIAAWMFYLAITYSDPFKRMFPIPVDGLGMNALLQNPYMVFHPPSLFTGYTALAIPFAYSMAALSFGDITQGWLRTTRRWTLYAWSFLTVGIFLGGRWAYVELGWAGYWAWDPVENSSFMPWLFATALLHSLIVQDKIGHLKRLSIILACLAFYFSFFGTFITRSGIISSVHSFAQSPIGPNYLLFLGIVLTVVLIIYAWRAPSILPAEVTRVWGVSKESALVVTQFLVISFAIIILIGTVYPIISEAITGARFNVQAPYFNTFAPYIGFSFIIAIALGNLMRYRSNRLVGGVKFQLFALLIASIPTILFCIFGNVFSSQGIVLYLQVAGILFCFWAIVCLVYDVHSRYSDLRGHLSLFVKRNLSYLGAFIAHIGVITAILGFLGNYRSVQKTVTLAKGESVSFYGYNFLFDGIKIKEEENATLFTAPLSFAPVQDKLIQVVPARAKYPTSSELFHEVGIDSTFWHDLYVVLADFKAIDLDHATFEIHINPTVRIVWLSGILMVLGGLICLFDRYRGKKNRDVLFQLGHK